MEVVLISEPREALALSGEFTGASVSLKSVAWESEVALIVDMGEQRTGGYSVRVDAVETADSDCIHLKLVVTRPGRDAFVTQAFTRPYTVARLPRAGLRPGEVTVTAVDQTGAQIIHQVVRL
jgi:hypothetical protein